MAQGTRTSTCTYCTNPVSEVAGFVKLGLNKIAHIQCHVAAASETDLAIQEKVLTESFQRKEKELLEEINNLKRTKGDTTVVVSRESTITFDTKTWDEAAERICKLAVAHIGPALPLHTLKRYAWFIYTKLRDEKLIQPLSGDKPEETKNEAMERSKRELEEWLRNTTVKKEE